MHSAITGSIFVILICLKQSLGSCSVTKLLRFATYGSYASKKWFNIFEMGSWFLFGDQVIGVCHLPFFCAFKIYQVEMNQMKMHVVVFLLVEIANIMCRFGIWDEERHFSWFMLEMDTFFGNCQRLNWVLLFSNDMAKCENWKRKMGLKHWIDWCVGYWSSSPATERMLESGDCGIR